MKFYKPNRLLWLLCLLLITALACTTPSATPTQSSDAPTNAPTAEAASSPSAPQQSAVAPVALPSQRLDHAGDVDSSVSATDKKAPGGDNFVQDLFERPFNANTMDTYFPYVDIVDTQGFMDNTWGYATITLSGTDANGHLPGKYGVELDLNKDGRGDWLIVASNPLSTTWTTQGVQAWKDTDGDVGGSTPITANPPPGGDGYETLVFDQGKGDNADGAWVQISANDPKTVVLAFRLSMLGNPKSYAMGAWAGNDLNPAMFDYNDHMTSQQAGSPLPALNLYPLKGLAEIDNTCRLAIGFVATSKVPGLCTVPTKNKPATGCTNTCQYGYVPNSCQCRQG